MSPVAEIDAWAGTDDSPRSTFSQRKIKAEVRSGKIGALKEDKDMDWAQKSRSASTFPYRWSVEKRYIRLGRDARFFSPNRPWVNGVYYALGGRSFYLCLFSRVRNSRGGNRRWDRCRLSSVFNALAISAPNALWGGGGSVLHQGTWWAFGQLRWPKGPVLLPFVADRAAATGVAPSYIAKKLDGISTLAISKKFGRDG